MKIFLPILALLLLAHPEVALAYNNWGVEVEFLSIFDIFFDILSFSIAIVSFFIAFQVLNKISGKLRKSWIYFLVTIVMFIVLQFLTLLSLLRIFDLTSLFSILKFILSIGILIAILFARSFFNILIMKKSSQNNSLKDL